ncbi:hypothetical protein EV670_0407 [Rivibacter subsaxonicus]|uniref:Lipoprotein n=1 Tax=Rivibacter subsaxonicus TaxID=457575 RepID=A0A4Q7VZP6_9BURK|nr:hypothetical protein EV670_0407 [Rivibacter subsaxonicus]
MSPPFATAPAARIAVLAAWAALAPALVGGCDARSQPVEPPLPPVHADADARAELPCSRKLCL